MFNFFIDRPIFSSVISLIITLAGAVAALDLPITQYPQIVPPQVSVTTFYPGASGRVIETAVAQPIEAKVVGVDKMIYMRSTSGNDGSYNLTVSFLLGTDPDVDTVMAAIVGAAGLAPAIAAARAGKRLLLANKEAIVLGGALFMRAVEQGGAAHGAAP